MGERVRDALGTHPDLELAAALEAAADKLIETGDFETIAQNWGLEAGLIDDAEIRKG